MSNFLDRNALEKYNKYSNMYFLTIYLEGILVKPGSSCQIRMILS